ncbi:potassium channel subfamily K member 16-like isoform X2 [Homarus americanus]|uniref:potassium channel subfamily K member 16-like isoform X2 n=1 Tax=Homarus americanus TaxID=6706 RepID=UPI001C46C68A|nr:potassium channel subfamily K member 16-like isoform X2 [Homarus americanus]
MNTDEEAKSDDDYNGLVGSWWQRMKENERLRKAAGHVSFFLVLVLYTSLGAKVFQVLEYKVEMRNQEQVWTHLQEKRQQLIEQVLNLTSLQQQQEDDGVQMVTDEPGTEELVWQWLREYEVVMEESEGAGVSPLDTQIHTRWAYTQALFFSATVLTTIGYGNIAPSTVEGRVFCMVYALVGIPLTLSVIADLGDVLASFIPANTFENRLPKGKLRAVTTVLLILTLLVGFIALGGVLFMWQNNWTFMEGFYFSFITTTTIGFGDLVPGLALTSMVIELVRRKYASSWAQMKQLSSRLHTLSGPLAEAMRKLAESGAGEVEMDEELVRELRDLNVALAKVQQEETGTETVTTGNEDAWAALLDMAAKKKRITVVMYESNV